MHHYFLPCFNSPSVLQQQQGALLHFQVWRVSTYTKSLIRTDLHCAALKPQSCWRRKEKCLRVDCLIAHKRDKGRQQQTRNHSELLDSFYSSFFLPLSSPKRMGLPFLLLSGRHDWLFPSCWWACWFSNEFSVKWAQHFLEEYGLNSYLKIDSSLNCSKEKIK